MLKKFLFMIVLSVLCYSNSFGANGFFLEGGIGGRYIDGGIEYNKFVTIHYKESVTDNSSLNWNSKLLTNYNGSFGLRWSDKLITSLSIYYFGKKAGYGGEDHQLCIQI